MPGCLGICVSDLIGLTMRSAAAEGYAEERDAIARDWYSFLAAAVPELGWVLLPNLGPAVVDYARARGVDRLLLSGGADPGSAPARDTSELALLRDAATRGLPVLGVCRGLQVMQLECGGTIVPCDRGRHAGTNHAIRWIVPPDARSTWTNELRVNSYHGLAASARELGQELELLAVAEDGTVEALRHLRLPWLGIQWHPEREKTPAASDVVLIRSRFGLEAE